MKVIYYSEGLEWESREERDVAIGAGRLIDAIQAGRYVDFEDVMREHDVLERHWDAVKADVRMHFELLGFARRSR